MVMVVIDPNNPVDVKNAMGVRGESQEGMEVNLYTDAMLQIAASPQTPVIPYSMDGKYPLISTYSDAKHAKQDNANKPTKRISLLNQDFFRWDRTLQALIGLRMCAKDTKSPLPIRIIHTNRIDWMN